MSNKVWLPKAEGGGRGARAPALESHWVGVGCCTGVAGGEEDQLLRAQSWEDLCQTSHCKVSSGKLWMCPDGTHSSVWGHCPQAWPWPHKGAAEGQRQG